MNEHDKHIRELDERWSHTEAALATALAIYKRAKALDAATDPIVEQLARAAQRHVRASLELLEYLAKPEIRFDRVRAAVLCMTPEERAEVFAALDAHEAADAAQDGGSVHG